MSGGDAEEHRSARLVASVYLSRHGRTKLNAAGMLRGHLDPALDEVGRGQARGLGLALAQFEPSLIVSSPLTRAVETARYVSDECGGADGVEIDDRLIDRDYGPWAGHRLEEVLAKWGSVEDAPGVEPMAAFQARAMAALEAVAERACGDAVVVAHDAVNRTLISALAPIEYPVADTIPQRTGCYNLLEFVGGKGQVASVDVCPEDRGDIRLGSR
ncbi:MAG: histidine phosphatase family protein [Acidimicrobiales bacterium]